MTPAGMPVIVSGFMQGSWKIAAFQFVALFIRFAGWYFFFKIADRIAFAEETEEERQAQIAEQKRASEQFEAEQSSEVSA